ncbi:MAG: hypothetical protein IKH57_16470 [Clostridia bacterium]|nr:hypothetical protein [Clostridia bacterium]
MKRWISIILALLLALGAAPVMAENDTLMEKFYQQAMKESAYRGTVSFTVIGEATSVLPGETWQIIKTLAPKLSVTLEHTTQRNKDEGEADVTFTVSGLPDMKLSFLYDEALTGVFSEALNPDTVYTAARDWSWTRLFTAASQEGESWPPLWQMLLNVLNASESWKKRAEPLLEGYETEAAVWMNTFASVSMGKDGGKQYSELSCKIPAREVKEEIKALLKRFYQDQQLLDLLKEVATPQEAAAYLQPSAESALTALLDGITMEGYVEIARRHDSSGTALLDSISFPFAQDALFTRLAFSVSPSEGGQEWHVNGAMKNGGEFDVSCKQTAPGIYTGSVALLVPVTKEGASFVVSDGTPELKPIGFDYSLTWDQGEEAYSLADDKSTQAIRGSLMIMPREGTDLPMQIFTLNAELSSGSSKQSSTHLDGSISWMDMVSGAAVTAQLSSRTVAPFDYSLVSQAENTVRIDEMSGGERASLLQDWIGYAAQFFSSVLMGNETGTQE